VIFSDIGLSDILAASIIRVKTCRLVRCCVVLENEGGTEDAAGIDSLSMSVRTADVCTFPGPIFLVVRSGTYTIRN
jgi:hypothetical protein